MRLKEPLQGLVMMQGHVVMHAAMLVASFMADGDVTLMRLAHALTVMFVCLSIAMKDKMAASLVNLLAPITYVGAMLYVNYADYRINMSETEKWIDLEILVFCCQIYAMVLFMLIANVTSMNSIWHSSYPNELSPCGTYII